MCVCVCVCVCVDIDNEVLCSQGFVECEGPNNRLYEFTGNIKLSEYVAQHTCLKRLLDIILLTLTLSRPVNIFWQILC